jgi:hypothetical protein
VLHVWFEMLAEAAQTSSMYTDVALLRSADQVAQLQGMLRFLVDISFGPVGQFKYKSPQRGSSHTWVLLPADHATADEP